VLAGILALINGDAAPADTSPKEKSPGADAASKSPIKKYALLVGCTEYVNVRNVPKLDGPANDVPLFAGVLKESFGFADADITCLVGWPDDAKARPSYANICAAFEDLIRKAGPGVQIVISLSGHGTQIPIPESQTDALDPSNPEPDGMDEVFLPADVKSWGGPNRLDNAIIDDQIGVWLDQLRAKGANVWIIFDCCHAGTMSRGTDIVERTRGVKPQGLGVPDKAIEDAVKKADEAVNKAQADGKLSGGDAPAPVGALALAPSKGAAGSVVAFYAAQAFEEAPELPRPADAPRTPEHYFGLFSYTLTTALKQRQGPLTYRELGQILVGRYRAERGSRAPTPFFEGDLDREVLGLKVWPKRAAIVLEHDQDKLRLTAGELMGLTTGTVLAVHPPAGGTRDPKDILGYVKVQNLTPTTAEVVPCEFNQKPALAANQFPELAGCEVVARDFGDMRVKVALGGPAGSGRAKLAEALKQLSEDTQILIDLVPSESEAEWVVREEAGKVVLQHGEGRTIDPRDQQSGERPRAERFLPPQKSFGGYPANDAQDIARQLDRDLRKIFTWHNVWRVAGTVGNNPSTSDDLKFEVVKLKDKDAPDGPLLNGGPVAPGQRIEIRLRNEGTQDLWVTLLFLDPNLGIQVLSTSIKAGRSLAPRGTIKGDSPGPEGVIVLAVSMEVQKMEPKLDFLAQEPLGREDKTRGGSEPTTEFGRLLKSAKVGKGTRSFEPDVSTNPLVHSWSWVTMAPASPGK
jgi:hypothetical protein